jgi:hypothetical protein
MCKSCDYECEDNYRKLTSCGKCGLYDPAGTYSEAIYDWLCAIHYENLKQLIDNFMQK